MLTKEQKETIAVFLFELSDFPLPSEWVEIFENILKEKECPEVWKKRINYLLFSIQGTDVEYFKSFEEMRNKQLS